MLGAGAAAGSWGEACDASLGQASKWNSAAGHATPLGSLSQLQAGAAPAASNSKGSELGQAKPKSSFFSSKTKKNWPRLHIP